MSNMEDKEISETLSRLREAWENAPYGVKAKINKKHNYSAQLIADMLKNGRKDESQLLALIEVIKKTSEEVSQEISEQNELVQGI